ncbi:GPCR fungal pheromone mating factor [Mycena vitilis]|nr:GPCR fungal pheromone mating factor [Mycena vitilis]
MPGALPSSAFISLFLATVPLVLHSRTGNVPLLSILVWLAVSALTYGINSVIWYGNVQAIALPWCDIVTKLKIGGEIALPTSTFVLALRVYRITLQMARVRLWLELGLCLGFPVLTMALHTIVQGHRFDIYEDFGCNPAIFFSIPSIIILDVPPLIMASLALGYSALALVNFSRQRLAFSRLFRGGNVAGISQSAYLRLMFLTLFLGVWNAIVIFSTKASTFHSGVILPWTNWTDVHADFGLLSTYPLAIIPGDVLGWLYFNFRPNQQSLRIRILCVRGKYDSAVPVVPGMFWNT